MTSRTVWFCERCKLAPPETDLIPPEPPMHAFCESSCMRRTIDDTDTGGPAQAPAGVNAKAYLQEACAEPATKAKPRRMK